ncbi:hypothetical protein [Rhodoferax ferrireducens]|uniref:hypothetical protein n=1 Tax=Rhodoferax ferrireducens TaxID=192843 RepID=UPI000E0DDFB2|nr:hypothetical protein [Rhodoferax ferrireducens]
MSNDIQIILTFTALALMTLIVIGYTGLKLAEKNGPDVRVVWYLFSLAAVATCIVADWASSIGAIDNQGVYRGELGAAVNAFLKFMLDLETDLKIFSAILAMVLLPQITSYVLSGLFGCASAPIFVNGTIRFFIWSIVKSFVVAAGIVLSVALFGYFNRWNGWSSKGTAAMLSMSSFLLMMAFSMLYLYRDAHATVAKPSTKQFTKFHQMVAHIHGWLTRRVS